MVSRISPLLFLHISFTLKIPSRHIFVFPICPAQPAALPAERRPAPGTAPTTQPSAFLRMSCFFMGCNTLYVPDLSIILAFVLSLTKSTAFSIGKYAKAAAEYKLLFSTCFVQVQCIMSVSSRRLWKVYSQHSATLWFGTVHRASAVALEQQPWQKRWVWI